MKFVIFLFVIFVHLHFIAGQEVTTICTEEKSRHGWRCNGKVYTDPDYHDPFPSVAFWVDILIILAMVVVAGIMSGLTLGLLSLDVMNLEIIKKTGEPKDVRNVKRILPLVKKHHQLLVTLLLANAAAMEILPLALDRIVPAWAAIVISITLVLLFGEIIPQAVCSRYGLRIGASLSWLVWIVMYGLSPVSFPLGKALDHFLGKEEGTYFNRSELKELLSMHGGPDAPEGLTIDETTIMRGALELKDKTAKDIMMPISNVFMLSNQEVLDQSCLQRIYESKRSRIPIYIETKNKEKEEQEEEIVGCLLVKTLIAITGEPKIEDLNLRDLPLVPLDMSLYDLLNLFQEGKSHMAIVDDKGTARGIVTLEDVIEELIQEEILDELDVTNVRIHHILRIRTPKELGHRSNSDPNPVPYDLAKHLQKQLHPKRRSSVAVMDQSSTSSGGRTPLSFSSPLARSSPRLRDSRGSLESINEDDELYLPPGTPLL